MPEALNLQAQAPAFTASSTLNAVCVSPRSVLASRSRAALAMALVLPYPRKSPYLLAKL
jgi:hypothetical protein